jgi:hypothetical protein
MSWNNEHKHQPIIMSFWVKDPIVSSLMKRPSFKCSQMLLNITLSIYWNNGTCTIDRVDTTCGDQKDY